MLGLLKYKASREPETRVLPLATPGLASPAEGVSYTSVPLHVPPLWMLGATHRPWCATPAQQVSGRYGEPATHTRPVVWPAGCLDEQMAEGELEESYPSPPLCSLWSTTSPNVITCGSTLFMKCI